MNSGDGCAVTFAGFLIGLSACGLLFTMVIIPADEKDMKEWGMKRGRAVQFCIDRGGQWDDANVRCLKAADTITVQVKP